MDHGKENNIHPTAIIDWNTVKIGENCYIGPYCVLRNCVLGDDNYLEAFVSIGGQPETQGRSVFASVVIGSHNRFSEFVTIHSGAELNTIINNHCLIQRHAHIAHDCQISDKVIIGGGAMLAGHCKVHEKAWICGGATVHQFCVIGEGAFIGPQTHINKHVMPFAKIAPRSAAYIGDNERSLENKTAEDIEQAKARFFEAIERGDPTNARQENVIF